MENYQDVEKNYKLLEAENTELKNDLKEVKQMLYQLAGLVGMVDKDGNIEPKFTIKKAVAEITSIMTSAMMPNVFGKKEDSLEQKFSFLKKIVPLYEKYKHL
jgi:hypothetical protein